MLGKTCAACVPNLSRFLILQQVDMISILRDTAWLDAASTADFFHW